MSGLNIVFAGTPEFGLPCLQALHSSEHRLSAVYTQPDRPAGRGRSLQPSAVKAWAVEYGIAVHQPEHFKSEETVEALAALKPDVIVVIAYGLILPQRVLDIPKYGCINVHASLLPRWRGASPIQHAILYGDSCSGVTIMQMDAGMDTGDMLRTAECPITISDTAQSLHDRLSMLSAEPLLDCLKQVASGALQPKAQNDEAASYAPKILKNDGRIDWRTSADAIDKKVRAFSPWPVAYTALNASERIRIHKGRAIQQEHATNTIAGSILSMDETGITVACGEGAYSIERLQLPGKKVVAVREWLNGNSEQLSINTIFQ